MAGDDSVDRIADRAPQHRQFRQQDRAAAAELEQDRRAHQHDDAQEAEQEPGRLEAVESFAGDEEVGQHHRRQGHDRHEDAGQPAVDSLLAPGDQQKGDAIADQGESDDEQPQPRGARQAAPGDDEQRQEDYRAEHETSGD
jgi:hypothetical protein